MSENEAPDLRRHLSPALLRLRDALLRAAPRSEDGSPRRALRALADSTPDRFAEWWKVGRNVTDGPIDVIDFFSGCGGMSAGFRAVNGIEPAFRHVLAVDIDEVANRTFEQNLEVRPVAADVHELAAEPEQSAALLAGSGRQSCNPLVVIGCAPCQGFSSHRNARGAADERNGLFVDFALVALRLNPDFIVIENVPELCTDRHWPRVSRVREMLESRGYGVHLAVHNFAEFGLPQERFRAVMLAARQPFEAPVGFVGRDHFSTVRDAIAGLPPIKPGVTHDSDPMHYTAAHRRSTIEMIRKVPKNGGRRPLDSGPASLLALHARQGKPAYEDVYGRLHWDRPAITITHYSRNPASGRFVHPEQDRGLSVREAALLQGFPGDFDFAGGFDDRFRQIGNAVPPLVAAHLALTILGQILDPPLVGAGPGVEAPLARSFSRLIPALKGRPAVAEQRLVAAGTSCD